MKAKLTQGDYPLHSAQLNVEGCLHLVNSGGGPASAFFSWWLCTFGQNVFCLQRGPEEGLLANNWGLTAANNTGW